MDLEDSRCLRHGSPFIDETTDGEFDLLAGQLGRAAEPNPTAFA